MSYRDRYQMNQAFLTLASQHPNLVTYEIINDYSVNHQPIYIFRIGNPNGGRVMFDAACHGNEYVPSEVLYLYAEWLLACKDAQPADALGSLGRRILENNWTIIVPIVQVDGFPSTRVNVNLVDLNRNFDWNWDGEAGTGGGVCKDLATCTNPWLYRGPFPLSEPETQHYKAIFAKYRPVHYFNCHTPADPILWHIRWATGNLKDYLVGVHSKYSALASQLGQPTYRLAEDLGTGNYPCTAFYAYGIYGWSGEIVKATPPFSDLPSVLDAWRPWFITLSLESPPQPQTNLAIIFILASLGLLATAI